MRSAPHSPRMRVITETADLASLCRDLAAQPFVAVDTEFMRETTYWPKLCLIQAAAPGAEAVIDPLADGLGLAPFMELMANRDVLKVFHAARQDLEIFLKLGGQLPHPVFDTQIAAMACGLLMETVPSGSMMPPPPFETCHSSASHVRPS